MMRNLRRFCWGCVRVLNVQNSIFSYPASWVHRVHGLVYCGSDSYGGARPKPALNPDRHNLGVPGVFLHVIQLSMETYSGQAEVRMHGSLG